jgi:hypothetical protein
MAKLTQGTSLFWIDGATVRQVAATNINGLSAQRDSIETTDLEAEAKTFMPGLMSPGSAQFSIQFDPSNAVHTALHSAYKAGTVLKWALGWSDGTAVPTTAAGEFTLPTTRSFLNFDGFIQDVTFDFSLNTVVNSQVSIQVSGMPDLTVKA